MAIILYCNELAFHDLLNTLCKEVPQFRELNPFWRSAISQLEITQFLIKAHARGWIVAQALILDSSTTANFLVNEGEDHYV